MQPPKKNNDETKITDNELIEKIKNAKRQQDQFAFNKYFEILYDRYRPQIYTKCKLILKDTSTALDLVQDIFVKIIEKIETIDPQKKLSNWIATITYHQCIDYIRTRKFFVEPQNDQEDIFVNIADEATLDINPTMDMQASILIECLKKLSTKDALVIQMKYRDDFTLNQIATAQNKGLSAIKMELSRARERLKKLYEQEIKSQ